MKITAEDEYKIVTIEIKNPSGHISEIVTLARGVAFAMEFRPDTVTSNLPTEEDIRESIKNAIDTQKEVDKDEGLTEYTPLT